MVSLGCSQSETDRPHRYEATVVKTEYGIPHITAESWGSLGFGEAYTAAEDHICNMALALVQSRGESAAVLVRGPATEISVETLSLRRLASPKRLTRRLQRKSLRSKNGLRDIPPDTTSLLMSAPASLGHGVTTRPG